MHKKLIYNGKSSADMGLVIQAPPAYSLPERDVEKTHVPGRNGDIIIDNGNYQNTEREYSLAKGYVNGPLKTTVKNGQELYEWLTSAKGKYVRLEDDYDPDVYRIATYIDSGTLTDILDQALIFNAKFNCKPQRYLKIGENPIEYAAGEESTNININNLTHYEAKPTIKIENVPAGSFSNTMLSVKDKEGTEVALITLKGSNTDTISLIIDSETEECMEEYSENGEIKYRDASDKVSLNGKNFPVLKDGNNNITVKQYNREDYQNIPSYDSIIQPKQTVCESYFSPKDTTIKSYEEKYIIRSFNSLIKERESSFAADSYYTRLTELCDQGITDITSGYQRYYFPQVINDSRDNEPDGIYELETLVTTDPRYSNLRINTSDGVDTWLKFDYNDSPDVHHTWILNVDRNKIPYGKTYYCIFESGSRAGTRLELSHSASDASDRYVYLFDTNGPHYSEYMWFYTEANNSLDYANSYNIINPNNYLNGIKMTFKNTSYANFKLEFDRRGLNDFLHIEEKGNSYYVSVIYGHKAYIRYSDNENYRLRSGYSIYTDNIIDMSNTQTDIEIEILPDIINNINNELPSFIVASPLHLTNGGVTYLDSITYYFTFKPYKNIIDDNAVALRWKDKTGFLGLGGKAGWYGCSDGENIVNYSWSTLSHNFKQDNGIFGSMTDFSLRFVYFDSRSKKYLQYDFGANVSPIFEVNLPNASTLELNTIKPGYYKANYGAASTWGASSIIAMLPLDKSFSVEYLKEIPKYSNERDWPAWLNNVPDYFAEGSTQAEDSDLGKLNSKYLKFKVNLNAYYRIYETINEAEYEGSFIQKNVGNYLPNYDGTTETQSTFEDSLTVGRYYSDKWFDPSMVPNFPYDRANSINSQVPEADDPDTPGIDESTPDWLQYEVKMKVKFNSSPDTEYIAHRTLNDSNNKFEWITETDTAITFYTHDRWFGYLNEKIYDSDGNEKGYITEEPTIYFYSGKNDGGFYKYDNSNVWVHYNATPTISPTSVPIIKIGFQDSVTFYYIDAMPDYEEGDWLEYLEIERNPSGNQESPVSIKFKIKNDNAAGYYKANSQVHWKYYKAGETVLETLVNETNTISRLTPNQTSGVLDEIKITITPKWWML